MHFYSFKSSLTWLQNCITHYLICSVRNVNKKLRCCWDDRVMAPNQPSWRTKSSNEITCPMASMDPSLTDETPQAIFTFVTMKCPLQGHPRSNVLADSESLIIDFSLVFHSNHIGLPRTALSLFTYHRQTDDRRNSDNTK